MILIIHPKFDNEWKNSISNRSNYQFVEYDESAFFQSGLAWRFLQAIAFIGDMLIPRQFAVSSAVRKIRLKKGYVKHCWEELLKHCNKADKVVIIKPTGLKKINFPSDFKIDSNLKIFLWDSLARYPVEEELLPYVKGTTSPFDAKKSRISLFTFYVTENYDSSINGLEQIQKSFFVGRFSIFRALKALCYCLFKRNNFVEFYFGNSPVNLTFSRLKFSKVRIVLDTCVFDAEFVLFDLNEDSPSFRIDNRNSKQIVVDNIVFPKTLERQNLNSFRCGFKDESIEFVPAITFSELLND